MTHTKLHSFPRELRKGRFQSIDWRFTVILLLSLVCHIVLVLVFKARLPESLQPETISTIQKHYAKIVLERDLAPEAIEPLEAEPLAPAVRDILLAPVPEGAGIGAEGEAGVEAGAEPFQTPESRLPEAGAMASAGRASGAAAEESMREVAEEVENVGFLGLLTSGTGYVPESYIGDITDYGVSENQRMGEVLETLDGASVSKGPEGKGWGGSDGRGNNYATTGRRVVQGQRRRDPAMSIDELIGQLQPTANVNFEEVDRSQEEAAGYQRIASSLDVKPKTPTTPEEKEKLRRKPEHVMSIIAGHRLAITDCYKRVLKENPRLKGKVEVRFAVDPEGSVSWVEVVNTTIDHEGMLDCILNRISRWNDFGYGDPTGPDEVYRQTFTFGY